MKTRVTEAPRRRYPPEERRALILVAARDCISERGLSGATAREIATRCQISTGTLTHHFPSINDLLVEALRSGSEEFTDNLLRAVEEEAGPLERLHRLIDIALPDKPDALAMWRLWLEYWAHASHDRTLSAAHSERYKVWRGAVERLVTEGVESGEFRPVDAERVAREFVGLFDGLGIQVAIGDEEVSAEDARALLAGLLETRLFWRGSA